jgi:DNA-directed RNA polymerase specialized sigma24 family protein
MRLKTKSKSMYIVLQCAGTLPDLQRQIFVDRYFLGRKLEEIAEIEHCSLGTVKSSLHRATHTVRHFLRKSGGLPLERD